MRAHLKTLFNLLSVVTALGAAWAGGAWYRAHVVQAAELVSLPVPLHELPPRTLIGFEDIGLIQVPAGLLGQEGGFVTDALALPGQMTLGLLPAGYPIPVPLVADSGVVRLADPALEVLSLPITPTDAVGGLVEAGSQVNLYRLQVREMPPAPESAGQETLETTAGFGGAEEQGEVVFIATVRVVGIRTESGAEIQAGDQRSAPHILIVAADPATAQAILDALALTLGTADRMWVTLAPLPVGIP